MVLVFLFFFPSEVIFWVDVYFFSGEMMGINGYIFKMAQRAFEGVYIFPSGIGGSSGEMD